jgi:hypothetical protein
MNPEQEMTMARHEPRIIRLRTTDELAAGSGTQDEDIPAYAKADALQAVQGWMTELDG